MLFYAFTIQDNMNIRKRINARKVALSYIYQHYFFWKLIDNDHVIEESLFIDNIFQSQTEKFQKEKEIFIDSIKKHQILDFESDLPIFLEKFFDKWAQDDLDIDYLLKVVPFALKSEKSLEKEVNKHIETFAYQEMSAIDRTLFLLWYSERQTLKTPKEVLLNELIELAKRYADQWSPKLLNAIMHKIID